MSSELQNRLLNHEVPPPTGSWDRLVAALEENDPGLSGKLFNYQLAPPAGVWERLSRQLDGAATTVIPFSKKSRKPLRYAGMAAAILALALVTGLLLNQRSGSSDTADTSVEIPVRSGEQSPEPTNPNKQVNTADEVGLSETVTQKTATKKKVSRPRPAAAAMGFAYMDDRQASKEEIEDKYMLFIDGDGNVMRLSKKLFNSFACAAYDYVCKERISALQAKVASSAVTSDFTGILDILRNLQENQ